MNILAVPETSSFDFHHRLGVCLGDREELDAYILLLFGLSVEILNFYEVNKISYGINK